MSKRSYIAHIQLVFLGIAFSFMVMLMVPSCDTPSDIEPLRDQVFIKLYGGSGTEEGKDAVQLPDGGFIIAGSTTSFGSGSDMFLVRTDMNGNELWYRNYDFGSEEEASSIVLDPGGQLVLAGSIVTDTADNEIFRDLLVIKVDPSGALMSSVIFPDPDTALVNSDEYATDIINSANGGYFVSATHIIDQSLTKLYLLSLNDDLTEKFPGALALSGQEQKINFSGTSVQVRNLDNTFLENKYYVFGTTSERGSIGDLTSPLNYNLYILFWDAQFGTAVAPGIFGTETDEEGLDVYPINPTSYLISGNSMLGNTKRGLIQNVVNINQNPNNPNFRGNWTWLDTVFVTRQNIQSSVESVIESKDGSVVALLSVENLTTQVVDEMGLVKIGFDGDGVFRVLWAENYGSNDFDNGAKLFELSDGSFVMVGTFDFPISQTSQRKAGMIKVNPEGQLLPS